MNLRFFSLLAFSFLLTAGSAIAQDSPVSIDDYGSPPQTRSSVPVSHQGSSQIPLNGDVRQDVFRIRRDGPAPQAKTQTLSPSGRLTGTIEKNKVTVPKVPTLVQSADYADSFATPPPPPVKKKRGSHVWGQSAMGGYYDATGQIKTVVPGDELYKYGGTFQDGVAVPDYPVTCNFKGHTYRPFVAKRGPAR